MNNSYRSTLKKSLYFPPFPLWIFPQWSTGSSPLSDLVNPPDIIQENIFRDFLDFPDFWSCLRMFSGNMLILLHVAGIHDFPKMDFPMISGGLTHFLDHLISWYYWEWYFRGFSWHFSRGSRIRVFSGLFSQSNYPWLFSQYTRIIFFPGDFLRWVTEVARFSFLASRVFKYIPVVVSDFLAFVIATRSSP